LSKAQIALKKLKGEKEKMQEKTEFEAMFNEDTNWLIPQFLQAIPLNPIRLMVRDEFAKCSEAGNGDLRNAMADSFVDWLFQQENFADPIYKALGGTKTENGWKNIPFECTIVV